MIFNPILTGGKKLPVLTDPGTAADLLAGKQLIDQNGEAITGTIATKTASDLTASGSSIIVPAGYYDSEASKSVATATQATPSISVSSAGLITASSTQTAGYVSAGTKSATRQLTTQAGTTITPGTSQKTAVSSGRYTTGTVYVAGDADLKAANIKSGVNIFGVTGTYSGSYNTSFMWVDVTVLGDYSIRLDRSSTYGDFPAYEKIAGIYVHSIGNKLYDDIYDIAVDYPAIGSVFFYKNSSGRWMPDEVVVQKFGREMIVDFNDGSSAGSVTVSRTSSNITIELNSSYVDVNSKFLFDDYEATIVYIQ